jgi:hypothetical protein
MHLLWHIDGKNGLLVDDLEMTNKRWEKIQQRQQRPGLRADGQCYST